MLAPGQPSGLFNRRINGIQLFRRGAIGRHDVDRVDKGAKQQASAQEEVIKLRPNGCKISGLLDIEIDGSYRAELPDIREPAIAPQWGQAFRL